jgi:hypothetical protein
MNFLPLLIGFVLLIHGASASALPSSGNLHLKSNSDSEIQGALNHLKVNLGVNDEKLDDFIKNNAPDEVTSQGWSIGLDYLIFIEDYSRAWRWIKARNYEKRAKYLDLGALLARAKKEDLAAFAQSEIEVAVEFIRKIAQAGDSEAVLLYAGLLKQEIIPITEIKPLQIALEKLAVSMPRGYSNEESARIFAARQYLNGNPVFGPVNLIQYIFWGASALQACRECRSVDTELLDVIDVNRDPELTLFLKESLNRRWVNKGEVSQVKALLSGWTRTDVLNSFEAKFSLESFGRKIFGLLDPSFPLTERNLINHGWRLFVGTYGFIDESEAQYVSEVGLKQSIRTQNRLMAAYARNNLGVIFRYAANPFILNRRLSAVHLFDGEPSHFGPGNILSLHFVDREVTLDDSKIADLQERFRLVENQDHWSKYLGPRIYSLSNQSDLSLINFFVTMGRSEKKVDLLKEAVYLCEKNIKICGFKRAKELWGEISSVDYNDTEGFERLKRIDLIERGFFYAGPPRDDINIVRDFGRYYFPTGFNPEVDRVFYQYGVNQTKQFGLSYSESRLLQQRNDKGSEVSINGVRDASSPYRGGEKRRFALVVGNRDYKVGKLDTPEADAHAVADVLRHLDFNVTLKTNLNRADFVRVLSEFRRMASESELSVFFFAGHGIQVGGQNFAIPVDVDFSGSPEDAVFQAIDINQTIQRFIPGVTRLIFLDACRVSPYKTEIRSGIGGLAPVNAPRGTLIAFSTRDGGVALDRVAGSSLSPFTASLVRNLGRREDIALILRTVRDEVLDSTRGAQEPWDYSNLSKGSVILSTQ